MIGEGRPIGRRRAPAWLFACVAFVALLAGGARAQTQDQPVKTAPAAAVEAPGDGPVGGGFYLEADNVVQDDKNNVVTAEGHVEVRYKGRTLRAQTLIYQTKTGVVTAKGDATIINADGTAEFAKEIVLDDDMKAGVALGFSARLKNNVKIAADTLIRRSQDLTELNRAIYTPCDICAKNGDPKHPTWSIQADKVIQDTDHHIIYYQHAVIKVLGVPVLYAPIFWHPDTESKAQSGFLSPQVQLSRKRGLSYEQPYLFAISKSQDLVLSPIFSTTVNPFLNLEWRKRFYTGSIDARLGYTYEREFDNSGDPIPGSDLTSRSYVLANGVFDINGVWKWGFAAERVSDDLLFDRYDIQGVYDRRGLFETDSRRLLNQLYAVRQDQNSYLSISALNFQGLRIDDVNGAMPVVAPMIEGRFAPDTPIMGGRLLLTGNAVVLSREQDRANPALSGVDSRRATATADWRRAITLDNGMRIEPFGTGRVDLYSLGDLQPTATTTDTDATVTRALGTAGVDFSWPFFKAYPGGGNVVLEPLVEAAISPKANVTRVPDIDSVDFVFDETNLFDANRAPGFDVYESGARLNVGARGTVNWGDGHDARVLVGRSFRTSEDPLIPLRSGYSDQSSDWVAGASATPVKGLTLYGRTQLDSDSLALRRLEIGTNVILPFIRGYARYLHDYTDPTGEREDIEAAGDILVTKHWGLVLYGMRDLQQHVWARRDIGVLYQDECTRVEIVYHHEAAFIRLGGPSDTVQVRLTLATLGEQGYSGSSSR